MLKRYAPLRNDHLYLSDSETESDDLSEYFSVQGAEKNNRGIYIGKENNKKKRNKKKNIVDGENSRDKKASKEESGAMVKKAEKYQEYMKQIPIPATKGLQISFNTWQGLAKSIEQIYEQPLHYSTHQLLKQWDQSRIGTKDESKPLDCIFHPSKAEATIWDMEEIHRKSTSHVHLAKLWHSDPLYHDFVDPIVKY